MKHLQEKDGENHLVRLEVPGALKYLNSIDDRMGNAFLRYVFRKIVEFSHTQGITDVRIYRANGDFYLSVPKNIVPDVEPFLAELVKAVSTDRYSYDSLNAIPLQAVAVSVDLTLSRNGPKTGEFGITVDTMKNYGEAQGSLAGKMEKATVAMFRRYLSRTVLTAQDKEYITYYFNPYDSRGVTHLLAVGATNEAVELFKKYYHDESASQVSGVNTRNIDAAIGAVKGIILGDDFIAATLPDAYVWRTDTLIRRFFNVDPTIDWKEYLVTRFSPLGIITFPWDIVKVIFLSHTVPSFTEHAAVILVENSTISENQERIAMITISPTGTTIPGIVVPSYGISRGFYVIGTEGVYKGKIIDHVNTIHLTKGQKVDAGIQESGAESGEER